MFTSISALGGEGETIVPLTVLGACRILKLTMVSKENTLQIMVEMNRIESNPCSPLAIIVL